MRILVASHLLPSPQAPHAGGQVVFHVLRELAVRGHTIDLLAKVLAHERPDVAGLREICADVITVDSGATRWELASNIVRTGLQYPCEIIRWRGRRNNMLLAQHLDRLLETRRYDVVQLEFVQVLPLVHVVRNRAPVLQVVHDLESKLAYRRMQQASRWQRPWYGWIWHTLLQAELHGLDACTAIATFGAFDRNMLRTLFPAKPLIQAPIWLPIGQPLPPVPHPGGTWPPRLLFVGALWRSVNDQAARNLASHLCAGSSGRTDDCWAWTITGATSIRATNAECYAYRSRSRVAILVCTVSCGDRAGARQRWRVAENP